MTSYIITYRKRHSDKDTVIDDEYRGVRNAEAYATMIFNRMQLNRVMVVGLDPEEEPKVVYLQEANCRHENTQTEWDLRTGAVIPRCLNCGEPMIGAVPELCTKSG